MTIAAEGYPFIIGSLIPGLLLTGLYPLHDLPVLLIPGIILVIFGLFCTAFFRNPSRTIPQGDTILVSPADGKVVAIQKTYDEFVGDAVKVDIFLSVFDVHLNRIPASGKIEFVKYRPGRFFSAFKDKASEDNERTDIGISTATGKFRVAQIAGFIARRIVCNVADADSVRKGQLYGMIRFGSRTELTFPPDFIPCIKRGQRVRGGETIIARLKE